MYKRQAYKRYRNEILKENLTGYLTAALVLIILLVLWNKIGKKKWKPRGQNSLICDKNILRSIMCFLIIMNIFLYIITPECEKIMKEY